MNGNAVMLVREAAELHSMRQRLRQRMEQLYESEYGQNLPRRPPPKVLTRSFVEQNTADRNFNQLLQSDLHIVEDKLDEAFGEGRWKFSIVRHHHEQRVPNYGYGCIARITLDRLGAAGDGLYRAGWVKTFPPLLPIRQTLK